MNQELVDKIVAAVLYEGYVLYPYRRSVKNQHRWTFGGIFPRESAEAKRGAEAAMMQTQCLVCGPDGATVQIKVRFLHLTDRLVRRTIAGRPESEAEPVDSLQVNGKTFASWQEAVERELELEPAALSTLVGSAQTRRFSFPAQTTSEPLPDAVGVVAGLIVRQQQAVEGTLDVWAERQAAGVFRVTVQIANITPFVPEPIENRDQALMCSLASTHTILHTVGGQFVSLTDPPDALRDFIGDCRNVGCWPVLVGEQGQTDTMLASPIILYDYPQIAPESPGDLFDGTEIDEILTLRIMTLTDDEKRQASAVDDRVREMMDRTQSLARDQLAGLHGVMRGLKPVREEQPHG